MTSTKLSLQGLRSTPWLNFEVASGDFPTFRVLQGLLQSFATLIFAALLLVAYRYQVLVEYDYRGGVWDPNPVTMTTGLFLAVVIAVFLPVTLSRGGDLIVYALFCIALVPSLIFPSARSYIDTDTLLASQLVFSGCFMFLVVANRLPVVNLAIRLFSPSMFIWCLAVVAGLSMIPVVYYFGLPKSLPGLYGAYDIRLDSRESFSSMPSGVGYLWFWLARVFAPGLLILGLVRKSRLAVGFGALIAIYLFTLTALKSVLFAMLLILAIWLLVRIFGQYLASLIVSALVLVVLLGIALYFVLGWFPITDLITRRTLIVPGTLTDQYLRFYSDMEFSRWSYSFLSQFYSNPHSGAPPGLVGSFFGRSDTTATAHIWADGYANFGFLGMAFVTLITGILIWYINSATVGKSAYLVVPITASIGYLLANTALSTALLTHGVLLLILFLQVSPSDSKILPDGGSRSLWTQSRASLRW